MTCSDLPFHDAANIFPMHGTEKFEKLVESIQAGGFDQMKPIVTYHGEIVDGRNRYLAAKKAGKTPIIKERDDVNPYLYAWQSNGLSHDLTTDQRYLCWEKCKEGSGEWLATQEAAKAAANRARSEAAKKQHATSNPRRGEKSGSTTTSGTTKRKGHQKGAKAKAEASKTNRGTVQRCGWLEKHRPDLFELVEAGTLASSAAVKQAKRKEKAQKKEKRTKAAIRAAKKANEDPDQIRWLVSPVADVAKELGPESVDVIITDPPYDKSIVSLCEGLSATAATVLRPGGSCFVMVGQSYLPQVMAALGTHLTYNWTLAYLTPGGQAVQLWNRKAMTFWKPVLWYSRGKYEGEWIGDVCHSDVNDNDKRFHKWGQSESGMAALVEKCSEAGSVVLDPFCGAGTTGIACLILGRRFIGSDADASVIDGAKARLS